MGKYYVVHVIKIDIKDQKVKSRCNIVKSRNILSNRENISKIKK